MKDKEATPEHDGTILLLALTSWDKKLEIHILCPDAKAVWSKQPRFFLKPCCFSWIIIFSSSQSVCRVRIYAGHITVYFTHNWNQCYTSVTHRFSRIIFTRLRDWINQPKFPFWGTDTIRKTIFKQSMKNRHGSAVFKKFGNSIINTSMLLSYVSFRSIFWHILFFSYIKYGHLGEHGVLALQQFVVASNLEQEAVCLAEIHLKIVMELAANHKTVIRKNIQVKYLWFIAWYYCYTIFDTCY